MWQSLLQSGMSSGGGGGGSGGGGVGDGRKDGGDNNLMGGSFKPDARSGPAFALSGANSFGSFGAFNVGADDSLTGAMKTMAPMILAVVVVWLVLKR